MNIPPLAAATFWIALILAMTAGVFVLARQWARRRERGENPGANDLLAQFRELHARGGLSDAEFRRVRERLTPQLQFELSGAGGAGTVEEAAQVLKRTAQSLLAGWNPEEIRPSGPSVTRDDCDGAAGQRDADGAAGGAAGGDCEATPPAGGDSTEERR